MNFKTFLAENSVDFTAEITKHCQPFLHAAAGHPMYRGAKDNRGGAQVVTVRQDRIPRNSSAWSHQVADDWFMHDLGLRARSQAAFCSGSEHEADRYGRVCYAFPVGDFKYVWGKSKGKKLNPDEPKSPGEEKLLNGPAVIDSMPLMAELDRVAYYRFDGQDVERKRVEYAHKLLSKISWKTTNLAYALEHHAEVMVLCKQIVLVPIKLIPYYEEFVEEVTK